MKKSKLFLLIGIFTYSLVLISNPLLGNPYVRDKAPENTLPRTKVLFKTSDTKLQKVFDEAEKKANLNLKAFGKYKVLVEGGGYNNVWLETQPMGGMMYAKRDLAAAKNNIQIFIDFQRNDGRFPGMITFNDNTLTPHYGWFQGFCFPESAFETYFWLNRDKKFLLELYGSLIKFDEYLWKTRDSDKDGCLETWCVWDTGEDHCVRFGGSTASWPFDYPPTYEGLKKMSKNELKEYCNTSSLDTTKGFPVPIESMDIMSYSYTCRDVLSLISKELSNGKEGYWREKANQIRKKLKDYLWDEEKHACYDRDKSNTKMNILLHNNLRCMYFGSFDQQMADDFIKYHLMNPQEFWTPMPLPSIAANDPSFQNISGNNWSGQPQGLTFQRSINALENYGHYAELTMIGKKLLAAISDSLKFTQQFDPFKGTINNTSDGYGPSALASLEFVSRLYGIHMARNKIYWSCLDNNNDYSYSQKWGNRLFKMTTKGNQVFCFINGKEVFSFMKGIRVVSDLSGEIIEAVGIEDTNKKVVIVDKGKTYSLSVMPNAVYSYKNNFQMIRNAGFCKVESY